MHSDNSINVITNSMILQIKQYVEHNEYQYVDVPDNT